jgi:D-serine deaminase-like pyridoxal phosphate-dependent protein
MDSNLSCSCRGLPGGLSLPVDFRYLPGNANPLFAIHQYRKNHRPDMITDIRIPTLLLDETICRRNIASMTAQAQHTLLRPHFKTHQSRLVGRWFRESGIDAITVSSVTMARYFANDGWTDITIAFPVNLRELDDIVALASRVKLGLLVESPRVIGPLQAHLPEVDIWLKIDTGYGRTGSRKK